MKTIDEIIAEIENLDKMMPIELYQVLRDLAEYLKKRETEYEITGFRLEPDEGGFGELPY